MEFTFSYPVPGVKFGDIELGTLFIYEAGTFWSPSLMVKITDRDALSLTSRATHSIQASTKVFPVKSLKVEVDI